MNFLEYLGVSLLCAIGLFVGVYIIKNCDEEIKDGMKYFRITQITVLFLSLAYLIYKTYSNILLVSFIPTIVIAVIFFLIPRKFQSYVYISLLAIAFAFISKIDGDYILFGLIFIFVIINGTIDYTINKKNWVKSSLIKSFLFLIITIGLFFIVWINTKIKLIKYKILPSEQLFQLAFQQALLAIYGLHALRNIFYWIFAV